MYNLNSFKLRLINKCRFAVWFCHEFWWVRNVLACLANEPSTLVCQLHSNWEMCTLNGCCSWV